MLNSGPPKITGSQPKAKINKALVAEKNVSDETLETIKDLHIDRHIIEGMMKACDPIMANTRLRELNEKWHKVQFELQEAWGFPLKKDWHRYWWSLPHCDCPKMDNADAFPFRSYISPVCPIHGLEVTP